MDSAIQDEDDLWQRAFADSAGLFDNNLFFDPLVPSVDTSLEPNAGQIPTPFNNNNVAQLAAAPPKHKLDYVAPAAPSPVLRPYPTGIGALAMSEQLQSAAKPAISSTFVGSGLPNASSSGEPPQAATAPAVAASEESTSEGLQASPGGTGA